MFPVFFTITCLVFDEPTAALPKLTLVGLAVSCLTAASPVPVRLIGIEESEALLVTVILPDMLLAAVGLNAAVKFALAPGAKVRGTESPETLTVATEGAKPETITLAVPEFARRIVWLDCVPSTTFPKVTEDGVAVSAEVGEVVAVPLRLSTTEGSDAFDAMETFPARAPAELGLYVTVKVTSFPAAKLAGTANPVTLMPAPEKVIPEIVTLPVPEFASWTVFVTSLPTVTLPNATDDGEALRAAVVVPVPVRATSMAGSRALLVMVIVPAAEEPAVGLKTTLIVVLWPALRAIGRCGPEALNPGPATEIPEMIRIPVPVLLNVTVFVVLSPIAKFPKLIELGDSPRVIVVLPGVPVPLPVTPTQPDVTRIAASTQLAENPRSKDLRANRGERIDAFTRIPSRIGARVISRAIVRRGRFRQLLVRGTHLGQGVNPVREDSRHLRSRTGWMFGRLELAQIALKSVLSSTQILRAVTPSLLNYRRRLVGIHAFHVV